MRYLAPCLAVLALLAARPAASQAHAPEEGSRVRVSPSPGVSPSRWIVGTVLASGPDSLTLLRADTNQPFSLHRGEIDAVHASTGHRPIGPTVMRYALAGAVVGAVTGAATGSLLAAAEDEDPNEWRVLSRQEAAVISAVVVGGIGAVVGGVVGWRASGERWAEVPRRPVSSVAIRPDGALGVTLSLKL